jgi:hypothetical protein
MSFFSRLLVVALLLGVFLLRFGFVRPGRDPIGEGRRETNQRDFAVLRPTRQFSSFFFGSGACHQ